MERLGSPVGVAEDKLGTWGLATTGKDKTEEYVDCVDELSSPGAAADLRVVQDIPLLAANLYQNKGADKNLLDSRVPCSIDIAIAENPEGQTQYYVIGKVHTT